MKVASLANEPEPLPHALIFWRGFTLLADRRQFDQGMPQPILLSEILAYTTTQGLADDLEMVTDMTHYVVLLDRMYMTHARAEAERARRRAQQKAKGPQRQK